jgi:hypothetical protein
MRVGSGRIAAKRQPHPPTVNNHATDSRNGSSHSIRKPCQGQNREKQCRSIGQRRERSVRHELCFSLRPRGDAARQTSAPRVERERGTRPPRRGRPRARDTAALGRGAKRGTVSDILSDGRRQSPSLPAAPAKPRDYETRRRSTGDPLNMHATPGHQTGRERRGKRDEATRDAATGSRAGARRIKPGSIGKAAQKGASG